MGGMRGSSHKRVQVALKLPQLQNLVKRDKDGYKDEFLQQHRNYLSELEIFKLKPSKDSDRFAELVTFMSHVAPCFKEEAKDFGPQIKALLEQHGPVLHPSIRVKLVQALILLRNRGVLDPTELLSLFFGLFHCQDKNLRKMLYEHIVSDIKSINEKGRNPKLNKTIQNLVFTMLKDDSEIAAKKSLDIMVELYRKRVWVDARTVNVIATALLAETPKLSCTALNFFLNIDTQMADDDDEEERKETAPNEVNRHQHSKKTAKKARNVYKQVKVNKKKNKAMLSDDSNGGLFPAINLLHDPQGTVEKVFRRLRQSKHRFEVKMLMMNFISRVVGAHRLLLLPFYSHLQRYVASQQREVTHILAYLVQACHDLVPPDEVMPVVKTIAYNFVTERCPGEVMALGINSIREMAKRIPSLLEEEGMDTLVVDLAAYSKHQDKSVVVAARGFINFVRETYPSLLKSKDRGREHDITARPTKYGDQKVAEGVDGADLLTLHEQGLMPLDGEQNKDGEEMDDDTEIPRLIAFPRASAASGEEEEMDDDEEEDDEMEGVQGGSKKRARQEGEEQEEEQAEEGMEDDSDSETTKASKKARREGVKDGDVEEYDEGGEDEEEEEEKEDEEAPRDSGKLETKTPRSEKSGVKFASEVKKVDGPGPNGALDGAGPDPRKLHVPASQRVDSTRILTAEDFEKIKQLKRQAAHAARDRKLGHKHKHAANRDSDDDDETGGEKFAVQPQELEGYRKRRRATLEERLESVIRGREKFERNTHAGGLTNLEKERKKNYLMVRKGTALKRKTRLGDKQIMAQKRSTGGKTQMKRDKRKKRRT